MMKAMSESENSKDYPLTEKSKVSTAAQMTGLR
jgi:hypothetical protein